MTKTEQFITKAIDGLTEEEWIKLIQAVHSYAEFYAKKCLEIAEESICWQRGNGWICEKLPTEIKLPEHD